VLKLNLGVMSRSTHPHHSLSRFRGSHPLKHDLIM